MCRSMRLRKRGSCAFVRSNSLPDMNCVRRLFALVLFAATVGAAMAATIVGDVPQFYRDNQPFTVSIIAAPDARTVVQAIEDAPPAGWTVGAISHGGAFDSATGKVKWGPFTDA